MNQINQPDNLLLPLPPPPYPSKKQIAQNQQVKEPMISTTSTTSTSTITTPNTSTEQKYLAAANGKLKFIDGVRTTNERNKTRFSSSEDSSEEEEDTNIPLKTKEEEEIEFAARRKLAIAAAESQLNATSTSMLDFTYPIRTTNQSIPLSHSCIATRIRLYLNAPQLATPNPDDNRISAASAYQRIITAYQRDHGTGTSNTQKDTKNISNRWTQENRLRINQQIQETEAVTTEMDTDWQKKLEKDAATNWDEFYKIHRTNFFKDRHYMDDEFIELRNIRQYSTQATLLEAGCGVGNSVFPLLEAIPSLKVYCCDFSPTAIRLIQSSPTFNTHRCSPFVCDLSNNDGGLILKKEILVQHALDDHGKGVDLAMMMFCLSAIHPEKMVIAIRNVARVLKKGGVLWFRDYAETDNAQLKFNKEARISKNFYVRGDGTRSYFFTKKILNEMMCQCGLYPKENDVKIIERVISNRKTGVDMHRAWIHGRYEKK